LGLGSFGTPEEASEIYQRALKELNDTGTIIQEKRSRRKNKNNTSGFTGVYFDKKRNKWFAQIDIKSKMIWKKYFMTPQEANEYRQKTLREYNETGNIIVHQ
jgi:nucleoside-triphosphatase THEP1